MTKTKTIRELGQELINLATNTIGKYKFKNSSNFTQEVTCVSAEPHETFVDNNGELKYKYYNLRFNYTDKWDEIFMITLVCIEGYLLDKYPGERAKHNYATVQNFDKIIQLLKENNYPVSKNRILNKN